VPHPGGIGTDPLADAAAGTSAPRRRPVIVLVLPEAAAILMRLRVDWAREQFRLMGRKDAHELALTLISGLQGAMDLANAYRDPTILTAQARQLQRWINNLA
jgi:hypothetical protein